MPFFVLIVTIGMGFGLHAEALEDHIWEKNFLVPENGRSNPYELSQSEYSSTRKRGQVHAQIYPVTVTGSLPPYQPVKRLFEPENKALREWFNRIFLDLVGLQDFNDLLDWLGLHPYPKQTDNGIYSVEYPEGERPDYLMGFGIIQRYGVEGFTFSCAACHSSNLFGKTVLGMSNRFPKANELFVVGKKGVPLIEPHLFKFYTGAKNEEVTLLKDLQRNLRRVGAKKPVVAGLDTSLAQVALSLSRRQDDAHATPNPSFEKHPRADVLEDFPADSKPAVWWNLKYKNRWLSDGSVLSGNPILTNILWNEVGRGTDLRLLEKWIFENDQIVKEMVTAVFSSEAPRITDFFPVEKIDIQAAKRGEILFNENCAKCHGHYLKKWSFPASVDWPVRVQIENARVIYNPKKPVFNVGTDPNRMLGMKSLEKLNSLEISKKFGIEIQAQKGYVPPPLVGIWARWPYFHNNSIPNLCAILTKADKRPLAFYQGEANDPQKDFDLDCNGYPLGDNTPQHWKRKDQIYDTRYDGMGNQGHDEGIFLENGKEKFTPSQKKDLIRFLQTL